MKFKMIVNILVAAIIEERLSPGTVLTETKMYKYLFPTASSPLSLALFIKTRLFREP